MQRTVKTTLDRNEYGALFSTKKTTEADHLNLCNAYQMVEQATRTKKLPEAYDDLSWDRKKRASGEALHHEIYDIAHSHVLLCCRSTEGSKYGVRTTKKSYFLISKLGRGVRVTEAKKSLCAKSAKAAGNELGSAISVIKGKTNYSAPANKIRKGYKLVERFEENIFVSIWDKSEWTIGKTRIEAAIVDPNFRTLN